MSSPGGRGMPVDRRQFLSSAALAAAALKMKPEAWMLAQGSDPKAVTQVNPGVLTSTEHIFQVGNDRITAVASNYGHVRVRQDEGAPKFLNDYAPERGWFAGGIGYLTDGKAAISTYYPGNAKSFD